MRTQCGLGSLTREETTSKNMTGMLYYGKVIKVYPKYHSADVQLLNSQYGSLVSDSYGKGKYACRIVEPLAGYDEKTGNPYGTINPITVGSTVVVGFLNNYNSQPVILGCIYALDKETITDDRYDGYRKLSVSRLNDYVAVSNSGEFDVASNTGVLLSGSLDEVTEDLDLQDGHLSKSFPVDETKRVMSIGAVLRTTLGRLKIVANAFRGTFSILNRIGNKKTYLRLTEGGGAEIGIEEPGTNTGTKIVITPTQEISLAKESTNTFITIEKDGSIRISSGSRVDVTAKGTASLASESPVRIKGSSITISSNSNSISF